MNKQSLFDIALAAEGITGPLANVARSIYMQESSGGKNTKTSNAGAVGGMQIIPSTFASVADKGWDINNPEHNIRAGLRYIKQMDKLAGGDPALTAAGYYSGPGGMEKAKRGIEVRDPRNPNAPSQLQYGREVVARIPAGSPDEPLVNPVAAAVVQEKPLETPVKVAQAPVEKVVPPPEWQAFQQAMPEAFTAKALDFGSAPAGFNPLAFAPQATSEVNFRNFMPKRNRV